METIDITKAIENAVAKYLDAKFAEETKPMQFITTAKTPTESKSKASKPPKVSFKGQDKLVEALHVHYADFDNSELAEASRELHEGRCGLYSLVLTWATLNKNSAATKWAKSKGSSKALRPWWKLQS